MSLKQPEERNSKHAEYQKWLLTGDNASMVRYHQRCAHMALQRAQWDFTGSDTMKNLYSNIDKPSLPYIEEKHGKLRDKGIVAVMTSLDGRNSLGFDEYVMNYVWKFGDSNLEHYNYNSDLHMQWKKKNGLPVDWIRNSEYKEGGEEE